MKQVHVMFCLFITILIAAISGCGDSSEQSKTDAKTELQTDVLKLESLEPPKQIKPTAIGADITLDWDESDFGEIWDFESVTTTFPFTNTGSKTLVISRLQAGCGCTVPVADKTVLQPGESGTISVTFDPKGKENKQDKKVTIFSNSVKNAEKVFWIRSRVKSFVKVENRFINLGEMTMTEPFFKEFEFFPVDPNFKIESFSGLGKHGRFLSGEELSTPDGTPRRIRIKVATGRPWGAFHSQLSITGTGLTPDGTTVRHSFLVFANGKTFGQLHAEPYIVSLGMVSVGGPFHQRVHLFSGDGAPFRVLNTTILQPNVSGINVNAVQKLDGSYEIIVTGTMPPSHRGPISAEIMVETDVSGEEVLRFRIAGNVAK